MAVQFTGSLTRRFAYLSQGYVFETSAVTRLALEAYLLQKWITPEELGPVCHRIGAARRQRTQLLLNHIHFCCVFVSANRVGHMTKTVRYSPHYAHLPRYRCNVVLPQFAVGCHTLFAHFCEDYRDASQ